MLNILFVRWISLIQIHFRTHIAVMDLKRKCMSRLYVPPILAVVYDLYELHGTDITVVGSLKRHVAFWKQIDVPEHIINIVEHGYATVCCQRCSWRTTNPL